MGSSLTFCPILENMLQEEDLPLDRRHLQHEEIILLLNTLRQPCNPLQEDVVAAKRLGIIAEHVLHVKPLMLRRYVHSYIFSAIKYDSDNRIIFRSRFFLRIVPFFFVKEKSPKKIELIISNSFLLKKVLV
jgi:hypothetical protein